MNDTNADPLVSAMRAAVRAVDRNPLRLTPQEHREVSTALGSTSLRQPLRDAVMLALGDAAHVLPAGLHEVDPVERAAMLLPRGLPDAVSSLAPLRHPDGYKVVFGGPVAFVGPDLDAVVAAADEERRAAMPTHLRVIGEGLRPWFRLGPETWPDLRKVMAALGIRERGESALATQAPPAGLFGPIGPRELVSLSPALVNLVNAVVRAEPLVGLAWLRVEAARRQSREVGIVFAESRGAVETLVRTVTVEAINGAGLMLGTFEHRHAALVDRVVAMAADPLPLDAPSLEDGAEVTP